MAINRFALGLITACLFTTAEGRNIVENTSKVALKVGDKMLKKKLGIDMKALLEENEAEEAETETAIKESENLLENSKEVNKDA